MKLFEMYNICHVKEQLHKKVIGRYITNKHIMVNDLIEATEFFIKLLDDATNENGYVDFFDVKRCFAVSFHDIILEMNGSFGEQEL